MINPRLVYNIGNIEMPIEFADVGRLVAYYPRTAKVNAWLSSRE